MDNLRDRLIHLARVRYGMGQTNFEKFTGMTVGTIHQIKDGMSTRQLERLMRKCPEVNVEWLLTGEGEMIRTSPAGSIPLLPFDAVAGFLSENYASQDAVRDYCLVPDFAARGANCAIRIDGDSMSPRFRNGEILALRIIPDPSFFQWGRVYVLSTRQGCVVKKLLPHPDNNEVVICRSENQVDFPDYTINKSDILHVALVVGHIGLD